MDEAVSKTIAEMVGTQHSDLQRPWTQTVNIDGLNRESDRNETGTVLLIPRHRSRKHGSIRRHGQARNQLEAEMGRDGQSECLSGGL